MCRFTTILTAAALLATAGAARAFHEVFGFGVKRTSGADLPAGFTSSAGGLTP